MSKKRMLRQIRRAVEGRTIVGAGCIETDVSNLGHGYLIMLGLDNAVMVGLPGLFRVDTDAAEFAEKVEMLYGGRAIQEVFGNANETAQGIGVVVVGCQMPLPLLLVCLPDGNPAKGFRKTIKWPETDPVVVPRMDRSNE